MASSLWQGQGYTRFDNDGNDDDNGSGGGGGGGGEMGRGTSSKWVLPIPYETETEAEAEAETETPHSGGATTSKHGRGGGGSSSGNGTAITGSSGRARMERTGMIRVLHIGYVGADWGGDHPAAELMRGMMRHHRFSFSFPAERGREGGDDGHAPGAGAGAGRGSNSSSGSSGWAVRVTCFALSPMPLHQHLFRRQEGLRGTPDEGYGVQVCG